jgi:aminoglycoside 3-N-acetyltransferase
VHSSLSRLGFVLGGAQTAVQALLDVVGPGGTLMMPTHSGSLCDPVNWKNPPVPESWWQAIRDEMPAFDPAFTPSRSMGAVVECFRCLPGVQRSNHPTVSAAAIGPNAPALLDNHDLEDRLGDTSPQGKLYDLDGDFSAIGEAFAATGAERQGPIGAGVGRLIRSQEIVDFGVEWIQANRA